MSWTLFFQILILIIVVGVLVGAIVDGSAKRSSEK